MDIDPTIRSRIDTILADIEARENVTLLFAIESGSRAWSFPSPDSDYDVRFVYARSLDWYLSLEPGRDVIELPVDAVMDVNGWDIGKALSLLLKPNPVLLEWLQSPIRYRWQEGACKALLDLAAQVAHAPACMHHYLHLAGKQWSRHIEGRESVNLKRYFYVVRPAMAIRWMRMHPETMPPMNFFAVRDGIALPPALSDALDHLLVLKSVASESGDGKRIAVLDDFIAREMAWASEAVRTIPKIGPDLRADADALFRSIVKAQASDTIS